MDLTGIDPARLPVHVACVMDGNGRWAERRGLSRTEGHKRGEDALFETVEGALAIGIGYLTVYAFSTENWNRPEDEVRFLLNFNEEILRRRQQELHEKNVRIRTIGRRDWRVPPHVLAQIEESETLTAANTGLRLTIAFNYGGRAEIVDAVQRLVRDGAGPDEVTEEALRARLYDPSLPDPDLVIRTSGEYRLSNFLLWEAAYAELVFPDVLWPDFTRDHLADAVREFQRRDRRFGGVRERA